MIKFTTYSLSNYKNIPQIELLSSEMIDDIEVVGRVLPFKTNSYVIENLIDWDNIPNDPMYTLTFPRKDMLLPSDYDTIKHLLDTNASKIEIDKAVREIRLSLNPNPAGQEHNIPTYNGVKLEGLQHKYRETVLFFPSHGQTCHAYCTFCFRWPQFSKLDNLRFEMKNTELLYEYLEQQTNVTDLLITGGDPLTMTASRLASYIEPLLSEKFSHIKTIRIGTRALTYNPCRFTDEKDSKELLELFKKVVDYGKNLSIQVQINHYVEISTEQVKSAIKAILSTGAQIRSQSPLLNHINATASIWTKMWREQVALDIIPYYMFVVRDTGSKSFFEVPLEQGYNIFRDAYSSVSGICRTVRGPSMSSTFGKIEIVGIIDVAGEKAFILRFLQCPNRNWVNVPFFAKYDEKATWLDDLKPLKGDKFFFEK